MTHADMIRQMSDDELVYLIVWKSYGIFGTIPSCDEDCENFRGGCARHCPHEKQERAVRKWLEKEWEQ